MIQINQLCKSYGDLAVLNNLHASFGEGQIFGVVGENGAGKTTFFRCLAGLESYEGSIQTRYQPLKNHLGFLPTEPYFFTKITGEEYIRFMCRARGINVNDIHASNLFDLPLKQYASEYSTGMKKKLALTAILLQKNRYFILDEPFNGLDIQSNLLLTEILLKLKSLGKTILISSHIFSTLKEICDQIYLLKRQEPFRIVSPNEFEKLEYELRDVEVRSKITGFRFD